MCVRALTALNRTQLLQHLLQHGTNYTEQMVEVYEVAVHLTSFDLRAPVDLPDEQL